MCRGGTGLLNQLRALGLFFFRKILPCDGAINHMCLAGDMGQTRGQPINRVTLADSCVRCINCRAGQGQTLWLIRPKVGLQP